MKRRPLIFLFAAASITAAIFYFDRPDRPVFDVAQTHPLFPQFNESSVAIIEIERLTDGVSLTRDGGAWKLTALPTAIAKALDEKSSTPANPDHTVYPADTEHVAQLVHLVHALNVSGVVSHRPESQGLLQVSAAGTQVRLFDTDEHLLAHFYIGKSGPDLLSTYVRRDGDNDIYLTRDEIGGRVPTTIAAWRDKTVWHLDADQIQAIALERRDGGFTLTKNPHNRFALTSPPKPDLEFDPAKIAAWIAQWKDLKAVDVQDRVPASATGLDKPTTTLKITLADGTDHILYIGNDATTGFPFGQLAGHGAIYSLPNSLRASLQATTDAWTINSAATTSPKGDAVNN